MVTKRIAHSLGKVAESIQQPLRSDTQTMTTDWSNVTFYRSSIIDLSSQTF